MRWDDENVVARETFPEIHTTNTGNSPDTAVESTHGGVEAGDKED